MKFVNWIIFIVFAGLLIGMLTNLPVEKHQKAYIDFVKKYRNTPQQRIDDTMKYIDELENGGTEHSNTVPAHARTPQDNRITQTGSGKYSKPLYVRDKNNPKILHKYGQ